MSDDKTSQSHSGNGSDEHRDLNRLGERLRKAKSKGITEGEQAPQQDSLPNNGLGVAMRIGIELVVAVFVGTGIGWLLDQWLGTKPWLMVLFFLLGAAAGFFNVIRVASQNMNDVTGDKIPDDE